MLRLSRHKKISYQFPPTTAELIAYPHHETRTCDTKGAVSLFGIHYTKKGCTPQELGARKMNFPTTTEEFLQALSAGKEPTDSDREYAAMLSKLSEANYQAGYEAGAATKK